MARGEDMHRGTRSHCVRTIHDVAALRHCVEGLFIIYWLEAEEHYQDYEAKGMWGEGCTHNAVVTAPVLQRDMG